MVVTGGSTFFCLPLLHVVGRKGGYVLFHKDERNGAEEQRGGQCFQQE